MANAIGNSQKNQGIEAPGGTMDGFSAQETRPGEISDQSKCFTLAHRVPMGVFGPRTTHSVRLFSDGITYPVSSWIRPSVDTLSKNLESSAGFRVITIPTSQEPCGPHNQ